MNLDPFQPTPHREFEPAKNTHFNPWLLIWFHPRKTIGQVARAKGGRFTAFMIPAINGLLVTIPLGIPILKSIPIAGLLLCISGYFIGPLFIRILAFFLKITGGWLGGKSKYEEVRKALAWAQAPYMIIMLAGVCLFFMIQSMFPSAKIVLIVLSAVAGLFCFIVTICTHLGGIAEIQEFSVGRAFFSFFLANIPMALLGILFNLMIALAAIPLFVQYTQQNQNPFIPPGPSQQGFSVEQWINDTEIVTEYRVLSGKSYGMPITGILKADQRTKLLAEIATLKSGGSSPKRPMMAARRGISSQKKTPQTPAIPQEPAFDLTSIQADTGTTLNITLKDGSIISGTLLDRSPRELMIEAASGIQNVTAQEIQDVQTR